MKRLARSLAAGLVGAALATLALGLGLPRVALAGPAPAKPPAQVVVKVNVGQGYTISDITASYPVSVASSILASHGIYLLTSTDPQYTTDPGSEQHLADLLSHSRAAVYAEPNYQAVLGDTQYHAWPDGNPVTAGTDPSVWSDQQAVQRLNLAAAHSITTGTGVTVAVLDTGVDAAQPVLAGHIASGGWNYVEDNAQTDDVADNGAAALGHGTFVAGTILLVAPGVKILPERVLDSSGVGNVFSVAEAILDATNSGAQIINMSFGTASVGHPHVIDDAIRYATSHGVIVVGAAGNDGDSHPHYPASDKQVLSVSALSSGYSSLASFSDFGPWVDVAAPGSQIAGPVPGGFAWWDGTSMATPFVTGQVTLLRSMTTSLPSQKLVNVIEHTARKLAKTQLGFGSIDIVSSLQFLQAHPKG